MSITQYHKVGLTRLNDNKANENHPGLNTGKIFFAPVHPGEVFQNCHKSGLATKPPGALHCVDTPFSAWYVSTTTGLLLTRSLGWTFHANCRRIALLKFKKEGWNENRYLLPYCPAKLL
jgi:hypothetical protein